MISEPVDDQKVERQEPGPRGPAVEQRAGGNDRARRARQLLAGVTVADGLMVLIGLVAAVARFSALGAQPLSPAEAEAALASWQFARGATVVAPVASPAYFSLTSLVMAIGATGDAAARLAPALIGTLTVLVPWLWRGRANPAVWLAAAAFLAASPLAMSLSRTAGGDALALFALLLLAVAVLRLDEGPRWAALAGAALGLGLATTALFYTGLIAFIPAWWVFGGNDGRTSWRTLAAAAGLTFAVVATGSLFFPSGLGAAAQIVPAWLGQFGLPATGGALAVLAPILTLLRYEPALLFLSLPAAVWVLARADNPGKPYALWLTLLLPILLLQSVAFHNAAAALVPGYLLIGLLAGDLMADWTNSASRKTTWLVAGGLILLGMTLLVSVGRFTRLGLWSGAQASLIGLAVLAFVLAGIAVILALAWDNAAARRGAFLGVAALLLYWQWGAAWQLSNAGANDPRERWVVAGTDDDVPVLTDLLRGVSLQTSNSNRDLEIFSTVESPVLRWYLRDFGGFRDGPALPLETQAAVIITPADAEPQATSDYFGADFGLVQRDLPGDPGRPTTADVLRWWLFQESFMPVEQQRVVVWLRSDLAAAR